MIDIEKRVIVLENKCKHLGSIYLLVVILTTLTLCTVLTSFGDLERSGDIEGILNRLDKS